MDRLLYLIQNHGHDVLGYSQDELAPHVPEGNFSEEHVQLGPVDLSRVSEVVEGEGAPLVPLHLRHDPLPRLRRNGAVVQEHEGGPRQRVYGARLK